MPERTPNPKLESTLRTLGIWVAVLMLPLMLVGIIFRTGLGLVFPGWNRRRDEDRRMERAQVRAWQEQQLEPYRTKTYAELADLPARTQLAGPERFRGHRFTLERKAGDAGGVEVAIRAAQRVVWPLWASDDARFEKLPSGEIVQEGKFDDSDWEP